MGGKLSFNVLDSAAQAYEKRREEGAQALRKILVRPGSEMRDLGSVRLGPPLELTGEAGLDYLEREGYLLSGKSIEYQKFCGIVAAKRLLAGLDSKMRCPLIRHSKIYTVLGPIDLPLGVCKVRSLLFLLPEGMLEPTGNPCSIRTLQTGERY